MKSILLSLFLLVILTNILIAQKTKILFLGNSYTYVNDLPSVFEDLCLSLGDTISHDQNTPGGYRFLNHAADPTSLSKIQSDEWDFVVLQAQSQEPSWPPSQMETEVYPYAKTLVDSIKANRNCSEPIFFMTWGRKYGDSYNCPSWPPVCTFLGMQERLMAGYMTMTEENASTVSPVGLAWKLAMDNDPDSLIDLYSADYSHPSYAGTYLTACVLYCTLFNKTPEGSTFYGSLAAESAGFLQNIAQQTVLGEDYSFGFNDTYTSTNYNLGWEDWFENGNMVFAGFDYTINETTGMVEFSDNSINGSIYSWDFGNGLFSNYQNDSSLYEDGDYTVIQTVSNDCFSDSDTASFSVILVSSNNPIIKLPSVYPVPASDYLVVKYPGITKFHCTIYNIEGEIVKKEDSFNETKEFDISNLKPGIYSLTIRSADKDSFKRKLIIE